MTYQELKDKWVNKLLYKTDGKMQLGGKIDVALVENYKLPHFPNNVIRAEVWYIPVWHGWKDEKQRKEFYKDAKKLLSRKKDTKCEYYKIIEII